jgi:hypothetical protein
VTKIKFDSKVVAAVSEALDGFTEDMFKQRAGRWVAVVEFGHVERTEPGADEEAEASVKLRVTCAEVAPDELVDEQLREAMRDMYMRRTKVGTLFQQEDETTGTRPASDLIPPALPPGRLLELEALDVEVVEDQDDEDEDHDAKEPVDLADHDEDTDDGDQQADVA